MARQSYFITGTDTDSGKTAIAGGLLCLAARNGLKTLAMKPLASGCEQTEQGLRNPDALHLQSAITESLDYDAVNPVALKPSIAPHVAAAGTGRKLAAAQLAGFCRGIMTRPSDLLLIEGAGGWRVPLNDRETWSDLVRELRISVILVVGLKLGCINHALLTAEMVRLDGLQLAGWIANSCTAVPMEREEETFADLCQRIEAPCMGRVPWLGHSDAFPSTESVARYLSLPLYTAGSV